MSVSQGVGLYLSIRAGAADRAAYDLLTDIVGISSFLLVMLLPILLLPYRKPEALLRFMAVYLAFMPVLRPAMLVHLFDGHNLWMVGFDTTMNVNLLFGFVREMIPLLFVLAILCKRQGFTVPKWYRSVLVAEAILCVGMLFLPEISEVCMSVMYYLLAILAFDHWEKLFEKETQVWGKVVVWLMFALFYLRGCERMLTLMANSHI